MKREILFRAKKWISGEWLEGEVHLKCNNAHIHTNYADQYKIDEETVCQYTGLNDINGTKIFEGDIVKYYNPYSKIWHTQIVKWDWRFAGFGLFDKESEWCKESDWLKIKDIEIVGNIYDNKELLK